MQMRKEVLKKMEMNQMEMTTEDFLKHYGILGMKWGIRKERPKSYGVTANNKPKRSSAFKNNLRENFKSHKKMSDAELRQRVNRLILEKQYRELKYSTLSEGKKMAMNILKNSGSRVAEQTITYVLGTAVNDILKDVYQDEKVVKTKKSKYNKVGFL